MRILPAIIYEKLGLSIDVATRLVQKHLAGRLVQEINHVVPGYEYKNLVTEILKDTAEEENIELSDEETEKIAELATELGDVKWIAELIKKEFPYIENPEEFVTFHLFTF